MVRCVTRNIFVATMLQGHLGANSRGDSTSENGTQ